MPDWLNYISQVGFPIVACFALSMYVKNITDRTFGMMKEFTDALDRVSDKVDKMLEKVGENIE